MAHGKNVGENLPQTTPKTVTYETTPKTVTCETTPKTVTYEKTPKTLTYVQQKLLPSAFLRDSGGHLLADL